MADRHLGLEDIVPERFDFNVSVPLVSIREDVNAHARCFRSRVRMRQCARMRGWSRRGRFLPEAIESGSNRPVSASTADSGLHEMLFSGGVLYKRLQGGEAIEAPD